MKALRVLVIEDGAVVGTLLAELLAGMGYDVCALAATEADAVIAATRHGPDLMIVDRGFGPRKRRFRRRRDTAHRADRAPVHQRRPTKGSGAQAWRGGDAEPFREADLVRAIEIAVDAAAAGGEVNAERGTVTETVGCEESRQR